MSSNVLPLVQCLLRGLQLSDVFDVFDAPFNPQTLRPIDERRSQVVHDATVSASFKDNTC
jgi:hypothetical protein